MVSYLIDDEDRLTDPGWGGSLGFGKHILPHWNAELDFIYNRFDGFNRVDQSGVGLDFMGMGNTSGKLVPYGVVGVDYLRTNVAEGPGGPPGRDDDNMAVGFGIGVLARWGTTPCSASKHASAGTPIRQPDGRCSASAPSCRSQREVAPPEPPPPPPPPPEPAAARRQRRRGVTDDKDKCPHTGWRTGRLRGCEIKEEIELPDVNFEFDSPS
jgi:hypothetical protein